MSTRHPLVSIIVMLVACCSIGSRATGERPLATSFTDTVDHTLRVVLDPASHHISVDDTITLPSVLQREGAEFTLNSALSITRSNPGLRTIGPDDSRAGPQRTRYALTGDAPNGVLTLSYNGVIDYGIDDEKEQYSRGMRESMGVIGPEGVYLDGGTAWIADFATEMITFRMEVIGPPDWHVISQGNGRSDAGTTSDGARIARWDSGANLEQVYLVGGPLTVTREAAGSVEVLVYLHEQDDALAKKYLDATARYIEMYRKLIGPYPYQKFALVENFWETGYGMPSFTLLGEQVIRLPFIIASSYPHEILHNWWGNSVFVDYASGNWCEGLTAYMADHLLQEQRGAGAEYRRSTLQKFRSYVKEGRDFPLTEFRNRHSAATEAVGYGKSLMMFHMLRRHVGDDAFRAALSDFYRKNRGRQATFDDIRTSFESVTGEDLSAFFAQWVERPGAPSFALRDVKVNPRSSPGGYTVSGTIVQQQPDDPFSLDVPIIVATATGQKSFVVTSDSRETAFSFAVDTRPTALAVDPDFDVFRLLDPREIPSSIGQIFGDARVLAVLPAGEPSDAYRELMQGWQTDDHKVEIVRDDQIASLPTDRAVWLLGRTNRFAPALLAFDPTIASSGPIESVALGDDRVSTTGHSLVVVRRNPQNPEQAIGWIAVDPPAAFDGFARKLPHYGKYSYLAFDGDEPTNSVKGQWEASDSPLVVEFEPGAAATIKPDTRSALAELPPVFSQSNLHEQVAWLAAPERQGRVLGSPELVDCAEYIAQHFEAAGLEPGGDNGTWFQRFAVERGPDGTPVEAMNVIGVLPGSRADWRDQSVVVGAHYDHLGHGWPDVHAGDQGKIHPGADDNASGVSVLLELARVMGSEGGGSRNLVFVAFTGEEAGLLGSKYYVAHPRFPISGIRGMLNIDTVGRLGDGELAIHATGTADEWQHIFRGVGFVTGIKSRNIAERVGGSDQESFIDAGVPAVQFFSGATADYHRPTDTPDKIDDAGLVKVATFVKEALDYLVEREEPLSVRIAGTEASSGQEASQTTGGRRVSFGTVPQFDFAGPGVRVDSVVPDSPAARAGVQPGDVLLQIDDTNIPDLRAFSELLKTLSPGQEITAVVVRNGARVPIKVQVDAR